VESRVRDTDSLKRAVGVEAAELVESGMRLGLGSGSTVAHLLAALAKRLDAGGLSDVVGVPTSLRTAREAGELGIPLTSLTETPVLDLTIDGADEVDPELNLIKGLGGALLREKMVAQASQRLAIMVDDAKTVPVLGTRCPVPIEVIQFGWEVHGRFLGSFGARSTLRAGPDGRPMVTDNGNYIIDCHFPDGIGDSENFERTVGARAGIVESGLFLGMATEVLVSGPAGVETRTRGDDATMTDDPVAGDGTMAGGHTP
jgi:ribose 5-phosphate isomerase A